MLTDGKCRDRPVKHFGEKQRELVPIRRAVRRDLGGPCGFGPPRRRTVGARSYVVTSASLIDAFLYGPVREELLSRLQLRVVRELPAGTFRGTKVKTCFTVWTASSTTGLRREPPASLRDTSPVGGGSAVPVSDPSPSGEGGAHAPGGGSRLHAAVTKEPHFRLRVPSAEAAALDREWRANGLPLEKLVPVTFPGLKTRFAMGI